MDTSIDSLADLDDAVARHQRSDYVYMYPPRQAYRPLGLPAGEVEEAITASAATSNRINLYVHFPFCKQVCGFCNLYTTTIRDNDVHRRYVDVLRRQSDAFMALLPDGLAIPTVYLGGGTPTLLPVELIDTTMRHLRDLWPLWAEDCEVAIEVDPQTVNCRQLLELRDCGVNRVNLGLQTREPGEIRTIGRRYGSEEQAERVRDALAAGFDNVCVDLIYGLPGQSLDSWVQSVTECVDLAPHTICCYPLTLRPFTGFAHRGVTRSAETYDMFTLADRLLQDAGYRRESHVRWARAGGGYRQKELHWGLENVLGIGAGARSYLWDIDLRSSYSVVDRAGALTRFMAAAEHGQMLPREGFLMTADERSRKAVILGLMRLDLDRFRNLLGVDLWESYRDEFVGLEERGFLIRRDDQVELTEVGVLFRDLIVQLFFSDSVREALRNFDYAE